jgi:phosphoglycerate-specific signal transduction histidine kinase
MRATADMNNKIQQRFDKSIREAVATTHAVKERESAAYVERKIRRYEQEIPRIRALIERGATRSGRVLSKAEIKELRDMLKHKEAVVTQRRGLRASADVSCLRLKPEHEPKMALYRHTVAEGK